jgi:hypothetical protein
MDSTAVAMAELVRRRLQDWNGSGGKGAEATAGHQLVLVSTGSTPKDG